MRDAGAELERLHILSRADVTTRNRRKADRLEFAYDDLEARIATLAEQEELDRRPPRSRRRAHHAHPRHQARAARWARR